MDKNLLYAIFFPTLKEYLDRMEADKLKLAHYTSLGVALNIINGEAMWMRDVAHMNDTGEVSYGIRAVDDFISDAADRELLISSLDAVKGGLGSRIVPIWEQMKANISGSVYISCFSEHQPGKEKNGRLSMWQRYCPKSEGVALVLNTEAFRLETNALNAYSSPVFYGTSEDFHVKFREILHNIQAHAKELRTVHPQMVLNLVIVAILFGAVCLKHPDFWEEREWRVIHMPSLLNLPSLLRKKQGDVRGREETIFEIPLKDAPEKGLVGIEIKDLMHQIIIGPSNCTEATRTALTRALVERGIQNPASRIVASETPLRVQA